MKRSEKIDSVKFIKYEEWEDCWCFKPKEYLRLETLNHFNTNSWKPTEKGVKIIIESDKSIKKPSTKQIESLQFVIISQIQIIESIYNFHQKFIFPIYKESIDIEEGQIISDQSQINIIYSIKSIRIPNPKNSNSNYFILNFNFNYDDEHDISFLFKNLSIIDFVGIGDDFIDYEELYEKKLAGDDHELTLSIYENSNIKCVFKNKYSLHEKIEFMFEQKAYTITVHREKWPQKFKLYFNPKDLAETYSLNDIINSI